MRAKAKERKQRKAAEQAWQEEQARLEAERVAREQAEAERAERERVEAEWEAKCKCKAKATKGDEAGAGSGEAAEVKKVVMDPGCTCCTWAKTTCEFLVDGNKKQVTCIWDGKDTEAGPKAIPKVDKGKKRKADNEMPEPGPSQKKQAKLKAVEVLDVDKPKTSGNGVRMAGTGEFLGLESKLKWLIDIAGLIANNLAGLFELHEAMVENLGCIADALELIINKSYSFGVVVTPLDSGSSELSLDELHEVAAWLQAEAKGEEEEEEETEGEDEPMAKAE
ncbi:hypothetical protein M404DRAFT_31629 [Pisolithus tinctorius Marx 270]|uniref:Uncharacterized protein n=1 Tax=Pisolithus tinctorius Marx 270 TaxID=870435 RepID=A0A0C3NS06_PISTI|nr:hypothetical protein M404DRAFT_31629 [Pisolithus tinctorius Marx 270]